MSKLLDPKILMSIKDLSLAAKTTIEGLMNGINKSTVKGQGMEFSQYRSYQPGDDLRSLDWKMFARSDRYYIRESEIETNIAIRFIVDASASMNHQDGAFKKIDYARYLAASLAYLGNLQGDAVGLHVMYESEIYSLPAKQDYQHLSRLFFQLEQIRPGGTFTGQQQVSTFYSGTPQRELIIFITDLYQQEDEIFHVLAKFNTLKHEVIIFHLMGRNELELDYKGYSTFEDLETGATIAIDQQAARKGYKANLNTYLQAVKDKALDHRAFYRMLCMDEPLELAIRDFLNQRKKTKNITVLQFLYPAGLLGALGIMIPLIIHLWNIKSGKTLRIGSIALLADPANQRSSNLKITDWPLLLIRCLLVILLAVLLAGPVFGSARIQTPKPGTVLLEKTKVSTGLATVYKDARFSGDQRV